MCFAVRHSTSLCDNFLRDARTAVGHVEGDLTSVLTLRLEHQAGSAEQHSAEVESLRAQLDAARITHEAEAAAQQDELDNLHRISEEVCGCTDLPAIAQPLKSHVLVGAHGKRSS